MILSFIFLVLSFLTMYRKPTPLRAFIVLVVHIIGITSIITTTTTTLTHGKSDCIPFITTTTVHGFHIPTTTTTNKHAAFGMLNNNYRQTYDHAKINTSSSSSSSIIPPLKKDLISSLDLMPLVEKIAAYTGTKRGRDALLRLVVDNDSNNKDTTNKKKSSIQPMKNLSNHNYSIVQPQQPSRKKSILSSITSNPSTSNSRSLLDTSITSAEDEIENVYSNDSLEEENDSKKYIDYTILKIASSPQEAIHEYKLVQEAISILLQQQQQQTFDSSNNRIHKHPDNNTTTTTTTTTTLLLEPPPIYAKYSNPFDTSYIETSDDDEWLYMLQRNNGQTFKSIAQQQQTSMLPTSTSTTSSSSQKREEYVWFYELEYILKAEQILKRIVDTYQWVQKLPSLQYSLLKCIGLDIDINVIYNVYDEIKGTVNINKGQISYDDPLGSRSFVFELNSTKYPILGILKDKETQLLLSKASSTSLSSSKITKYQKEIEMFREEINTIQNEITQHLSNVVVKSSKYINLSLDVIARIDTIFARAAFGCDYEGRIPFIGYEGIIHVKDFVHPLLSTSSSKNNLGVVVNGSFGGEDSAVIPIDLLISGVKGEQTLFISGINGGGKTVALKSFGLVAFMNKLGIPIPSSNKIGSSMYDEIVHDENNVRVDFFENTFVVVGDDQNLSNGESTYMSKLNKLSRIIQETSYRCETEDVDDYNNLSISPYSLILLDELGSGTDDDGSFIAQAIVEKMMSNSSTRIIATTHSRHLKLLSAENDKYNCAAVLQSDTTDNRKSQPTHKLYYSTIGNSNAVSALLRSQPSFTDDVIQRIYELLTKEGEENKDEEKILSEKKILLEKHCESVMMIKEQSKDELNKIVESRDKLLAFASKYEKQLLQIENRLQSMFDELRKSESDTFRIIGDSLTTIRLEKKKIMNKSELLRQKGLRMVTITQILKTGDSVVITSEGELEGLSAIVSAKQGDLKMDEVRIELETYWGDSDFDLLGSNSYDISTKSIILKKSDIAVWDFPYEGIDSYQAEGRISYLGGSSDSRRLLDALNSIKKPDNNKLQKSSEVNNKGKNYTSSRERKANQSNSKKKGSKRK